MTVHADATQRLAIYRGLAARNRVVAILRIAVPVLGTIALSSLMLQIYVSSRTGRFGIGQIVVSPDSVTVETPQYQGLLDDGTAYRVSAISATAAVDATDRIALAEGLLTMVRPDGVTTLVKAPAAILDTSRQTVEIAGEAMVSTSAGTEAVIAQSLFDYQNQTLTGTGPVRIDYEDGTRLVAEGVTFDAVRLVWTFRRATVTLADTPGAAERAVETQ